MQITANPKTKIIILLDIRSIIYHNVKRVF
jgi:hypothetical protein